MDPQKPSYPTPAPISQPSPPANVRGVSVRPSALSAPPDAAALFKALRRRLATAIVLGMFVAGTIGSATWLLLPRSKYTANASLFVSMKPRRLMFEPRDNGTSADTYQRTVVALIKDRSILSDALGNPKVSRLLTIKDLVSQDVDLDEWMSKNINASFRGGSEVLEVSLSGDRPDDLSTVVNAVVDSYMSLIVDEERKERLDRLEKLKALWDRYQNELKNKRKSLTEVAASLGSHSELTLALSQQFKGAQLNLLQGEQIRAHSELIKARAEFATLEGVRPPDAGVMPPAPDSTLDEQVERHPEVARLRTRMNDHARNYQRTDRLVRQKSDPSLVEIQRQWESAKNELASVRAKARVEILGGVEPGSGVQAGTLSEEAREKARLRAHIQVLEGYEKAMATDIGRLQGEMKDFNKGGVDLESQRQEIGIATDVAQKVGAEVEAVQVEFAAPERVRVLARAKPPKAKDESRRFKASGVAALGSFALVLFGVSFWEFHARRIDAPEDVVSILGLKLVGALPALSSRSFRFPGRSGRQSNRNWQSIMVESVNATRTMLLHASRVESLRVVMITSAVKGEGKTSLSSHLATSLARAGRKTLLIDGDLRRPAIHQLFSVGLKPGLCEYLRGEAEVLEVVQQTTVTDLDLLTAGRCDALALQALARNELQGLIDSLKQSYDFIIVDTAPVLPVADSLLVGQSVDGVIFSILRDISRLPEVYRACEKLSVLGIRMLGAVVSGVQQESYNSSEYYSNGQTTSA